MYSMFKQSTFYYVIRKLILFFQKCEKSQNGHRGEFRIKNLQSFKWSEAKNFKTHGENYQCKLNYHRKTWLRDIKDIYPSLKKFHLNKLTIEFFLKIIC